MPNIIMDDEMPHNGEDEVEWAPDMPTTAGPTFDPAAIWAQLHPSATAASASAEINWRYEIGNHYMHTVVYIEGYKGAYYIAHYMEDENHENQQIGIKAYPYPVHQGDREELVLDYGEYDKGWADIYHMLTPFMPAAGYYLNTYGKATFLTPRGNNHYKKSICGDNYNMPGMSSSVSLKSIVWDDVPEFKGELGEMFTLITRSLMISINQQMYLPLVHYAGNVVGVYTDQAQVRLHPSARAFKEDIQQYLEVEDEENNGK